MTLCAEHHRIGRNAIYVLGPRQFEQLHGIVVVDLVKQLNGVWERMQQPVEAKLLTNASAGASV